MTSDNFFNPHHAGTASLGQSQEEAALIKNINSNQWFIWGWVTLNIGGAFISSLISGGGLFAASFTAVFVAALMGTPAFFLFRKHGFFAASALFGFALFNAISVLFLAISGDVRLNIFSGLVAIGIIIVAGLVAKDAYKLRSLRTVHNQ